ncbi:carbohydrate kinase family protein [Herbiconiux sp. UC225_62]|uniref:carbohydrate kinase family protein n=1 Tax=Herbiconiux sp. UC225_62 TaxID=3350168 RepID=UPI0036D39B0D
MTDPHAAGPRDEGAHVVVFGDVIDDVIVTPAGDIRPDTDTTARIERHAGGSAANAAAWFGHLGCRVDFLGHVNADDVTRHDALLRQHGVTPHLVGVELPTGTIVVILQPDRTRTMLTERGANALTSPRDVDRALLRPGTHLHFTGYSVFGARTADAVAAFAALVHDAHAAGASVSVNPGSAGFIAEHGVEGLLAATSGADVLLPNLDEGRVLTGHTEPDDIVSALLEHYDVVALTLGREGVLAASRGRDRRDGASGPRAADPLPGVRVRVPSIPVTPVDTTGAGDAFGAAFVQALLSSGPARAETIDLSRLEAAALAGVRAAAVAVTRSGARPPVSAARKPRVADLPADPKLVP